MQTYGIKGKYNPNYKKELASQLKNFVDSIGKKDANFTDLFEELVNDCKGGILLSGEYDTTLMKDEREFVLDMLQGKVLLIKPRDVQQIEEDYGSVANYRKKMFGKTYVAVKNKESGKGYYIEDVITHIEENYPYLLNENADGDMGYLWLEDLVNNVLKPKYKNPYFEGENSFYETPETAAIQMAFDCTTEIINQQTSRFKADKNMLIGMIIVVTFRSDGFGKQIHPVGTAAQGNFPKRRKIFNGKEILCCTLSLSRVINFARLQPFNLFLRLNIHKLNLTCVVKHRIGDSLMYHNARYRCNSVI